MECNSQITGSEQRVVDYLKAALNRDCDTKVDWETFRKILAAFLESLSSAQSSIFSANQASSIYCDFGHYEIAAREPYSKFPPLSCENEPVLDGRTIQFLMSSFCNRSLSSAPGRER
jgi:hypothetical protein